MMLCVGLCEQLLLSTRSQPSLLRSRVVRPSLRSNCKIMLNRSQHGELGTEFIFGMLVSYIEPLVDIKSNGV